MTFTDWLTDTARRYRDQPPTRATKESTQALVRGGFRRARPLINNRTPSIFDRGDWDILLILDACRVDLMREVAPEYDALRDSDIESVWSQASTSIDWIERTFNDHPRPEELADVGYVTANPFSDHNGEDARSADLHDHPTLGHFRPLYQEEWHEIGGIETVPPEWATNHAIEAWRNRDEYGIDQVVVHYMQPHEPYITRPEWSYQNPHDNAVLKNLVDEDYQAGTSPWQEMVETGRVSKAEFWEVYKDNLRWVLNDTTQRLLQNVDADVVLTADHGNGLGEFGTWHHPPGALSPYVRKVPWVEVQSQDTGGIQPNIEAGRGGSDDDLEDQLEALGYA